MGMAEQSDAATVVGVGLVPTRTGDSGGRSTVRYLSASAKHVCIDADEADLPTSATRITFVPRIATHPKYRPLLGSPDPTLPATYPEAIKMRYVSLGACGPDFLYALMDCGSDVQDLENILIQDWARLGPRIAASSTTDLITAHRPQT